MKKHRLLKVSLVLLSLGVLFTFGFTTRAMTKALAPAPGSPNACTLTHSKSAAPTEVDAGGVATVTFTLQAIGDCSAATSPIDVILVIDRSGSMGGQKIEDAKNAAKFFVDQMDLNYDQVGIASFESTGDGILEHQLGQDDVAVKAAIDAIWAGGSTDIAEGLMLAETELQSTRHFTSSAPVIIILSDGKHNESTPLDFTADRIKRAGIRIISIGLGANVDEVQLKSIASSDNDYYFSPSSTDLQNIYNSIASTVRVAARNMILTDTLGSEVTLMPGSFHGPISPTVNGDQIVWYISAVPSQTLALHYRVVLTGTPGTYPTNASAVASYIDAAGSAATLDFSPSPTITVRSQCGQPVLDTVRPVWGCVDSDSAVVLAGGGFVNPTATIGTQALTIHSFTANLLQATLARGLDVGVYDAEVVNECEESATLTQTFTIYPQPRVLSVRPAEGYTGIPADLTICGNGFAPGTEAFIGTLSLENQGRYGETCLVGTVPADLPAGVYTITVQGPCGEAYGTYRVLEESLNDDLWGVPEELWVNPSICARECDDIKLGLIIHRRGGKNTLENVTARFYEGHPQSPGAVEIGDGTIPLLSPRVNPAERIAGFSTHPVNWTPSQGVQAYTIYAVIDPDNAITEDIEDNNIVSRTVQVLPCGEGVDQHSPHVDGFGINAGHDTTYDIEATLAITVTDYPQPGPNSGVSRMNFVEYLFSDASNIWVPVKTSGWLTYARTADWTFYPEGGMRFLQIWASDRAGNISEYPAFNHVNYIQPCTAVSRNGVRIYRQNVAVGERLYVELVPCHGDPDLYIWPSDWESGDPPWVSNISGEATEQLYITVTVAGEYEIEVYGYTAAEFNINIEVEPATLRMQHHGMTRVAVPGLAPYLTAGITADKPERSEPVVPPGSSPNRDIPSVEPAPFEPQPTYKIYLPMILRSSS